MITDNAQVCALLDRAGIDYEIYHHPPVYTVDEALACVPHFAEYGLKNLFLKDNRGRWYIVSIPCNDRLDMKALKKQLGAGNIRFADEAELTEVTGLKRGHVTPFGVLNAGGKDLVLVFDHSLAGGRAGIHPFTNDATIIISIEDLMTFLRKERPDLEISMI